MSLWSRATALAQQTPPTRNRYVDFLRAVSIFLVITGHWIAAAPYLDAQGRVVPTHLLAISPWTHWLTWAIQVMPIFFMVGGFSNGISWRASRKAGKSYALWLDGRLRRLVGPVLPLVATWAVLAACAHLAGVREATIAIGSQMALIPIWFLAVYVVVVLLTPITHALWERHGLASFWGLVLAAIAVDAAFFSGWTWLGWTNYLFVWSAVHQLGYAWRDERLGGGARTLVWAAGGALALFSLVHFGAYPIAMVGVPGEGVSNTTPPKVVLIALALLQGGLLLSLQGPLRRWLAALVPWTATVLVNGMIMTIYLWHLTAMVLVIGLASALGGVGLGLQPASAPWWRTRPLWLALLAGVLAMLCLLVARFEHPKPRVHGLVAPAWRQVLGACAICFGLAALAFDGVADGEGWLGLRVGILALPFVGAALARPWKQA